MVVLARWRLIIASTATAALARVRHPTIVASPATSRARQVARAAPSQPMAPSGFHEPAGSERS